MSKKVSLKDAFVRNPALEEHSDTASWQAGNVAVQESVNPAIQLDTPHLADLNLPSSPSIQQYSQPVLQPPVQPPVKKKATFNLDASLHQRLKIAAAMHSREMVAIVEDALHAYLPALDKKAG